jgi:hypothetical protein
MVGTVVREGGPGRDPVLEAERAGDFLAAYDLCLGRLDARPGDLWLRHRAVLMLARSGATEQALGLFDRFGLSSNPDEEIASLRARLEKDLALACGSPESFAAAAARYHDVYARTGGIYPGINAATLWLLAGHGPRALDLVRAGGPISTSGR